MPVKINKQQARDIWIECQKLNKSAPFGAGVRAVEKAVEHLGYVQIDTIHVIERCHHHILYNRIPEYQRKHLHQAQSIRKSVFEYWTHALSYIPFRDYRYFMLDMKRRRENPGRWYNAVGKKDLLKVSRLMKEGDGITIRDIKDDILVEKDHEWASKKPSKRALQLGFNGGQFVVSERIGMLKRYDLTAKHFPELPRPASEKECHLYAVERAFRSQGIVSLDSICHLIPRNKKSTLEILQQKVAAGELVEAEVSGAEKVAHWMIPGMRPEKSELTHILSPFDPLIIQRKRLKMFFGYEHLFEAYVPKNKRKFGYFTLPVLSGREIIAVLDLKTERSEQRLQIQSWSWLPGFKSKELRLAIEHELERFERFQLASE